MKHKHHIVPRHMGGTDEPENLIELSVEDHAEAHLKLYEEFGKKEDLCAYYMLSGRNQDPEFVSLRGQLGGAACQAQRVANGLVGLELFYGREVSDEEKFRNASAGGQIIGPRNAESGHMARIQKIGDVVENGRKGGISTILSGKGAFGDPVERLKVASKGGKVGGATNAKSGHLKKIAQMTIQENPRSKGKIWLTNGTTNIMICQDEAIPNGFRRGKTQKKN